MDRHQGGCFWIDVPSQWLKPRIVHTFDHHCDQYLIEILEGEKLHPFIHSLTGFSSLWWVEFGRAVTGESQGKMWLPKAHP